MFFEQRDDDRCAWWCTCCATFLSQAKCPFEDTAGYLSSFFYGERKSRLLSFLNSVFLGVFVFSPYISRKKENVNKKKNVVLLLL